MKVGLGFDAHKFAPGRRLVIGGEEIPFHLGLSGHSDADVLVHALMDALLGAIGEGDIGKLFPPTDDSYKDISSMNLLARVHSLVKEKNFRVTNADLVLICEEPKIESYREGIRQRLASALECEKEDVSLKATTTEGLGFTGEKAGAAALAVVLLDERK
ncbi:MAG: 2-C-methyl-D-erythritol 2,4-cyclodiphosphate synthase [Actinomycetota bacterium]|nr:2-C-methyl-D-erythritol 2,4-cyclodiphosphate synthase [Actinomycetota bacterium]